MEPIYVILARHGETLENRQHLMQGHIPGTLSPLGMRQAEELAGHLENEILDAIVCSDLARSYDTAKIVACLRGMEPQPTFLLREIDWGPHTGGRLDRLDWQNLPEGCETLEHLYERAGKFLDYLRSHYAGQQILVVGHGAMNRSIGAYLAHKSPSDMPDMAIMKNTEFIKFVLE